MGTMQPGQKPSCLLVFFALLHTLKECLGWPRESFSCPAAHYASAAICQLWGEPGQPAFHTAPRLAGTFSAATAGSGPTKADTETDVVSCLLTQGGGPHLTANIHTDGKWVGVGGDKRHEEAFPMGWLKEK